MVRVNRWLDFFDRVAWTFIATFPGLLAADSIFNAEMPWSVKLGAPAIAALITAVKVVTAQNTGSNNLGAAIPGQVIENERQ